MASYQGPQAHLFNPSKDPNGGAEGTERRGEASEAFAAPVQLPHTYTHATNHHNLMEPGVTIAHWEVIDRLTMLQGPKIDSFRQII